MEDIEIFIYRDLPLSYQNLELNTFKQVVLLSRKIYRDELIDGVPTRRNIGYVNGFPSIYFNTIRCPQGSCMVFRPEPIEKDIAFKPGKYVYLGELVSQYGHFILDSCSRLWPLLNGDTRKEDIDGFVFVRTEGQPSSEKIWAIFSQIIESIGLSFEDIIFVDKCEGFEEILVPQQSSVIDWYCHKDHFLWADMVVKKASFNLRTEKKQKVFLSRLKLKNDKRRNSKEALVEQRLRKAGVNIVYPELLDFDEQVTVLSHADTVIGFAGSALHNSIFAPDNAKVVAIGPTGERRNRTQQNLCKAKGQSFTLITPTNESDNDKSLEQLLKEVQLFI